MGISTGTAILGSAIIGGGASILGASKASKAAKRGAEAQQQAANYAADLQNQQFQTTRQDMAPWLQAGSGALGVQQQLLGIPTGGGLAAAGGAMGGQAPTMMGYDLSDPDMFTAGYFKGAGLDKDTRRSIRDAAREYQSQPMTASPTTGQATEGPDYTPFFKSPSYDFDMAEMEKATMRGAAAMGTRISGDTFAALQDRAHGLASRGYADYYNRLAGLSGTGMTASQNLGSFGMQAAGNMGNLAMQGANARASGYMGSANAWNQGLAGVGQSIGYGLGALSTMPSSGQTGQQIAPWMPY